MSLEFPKQGRKRLEPEPYQKLRQEVLRRDGWRCQSCGRQSALQVHHVKPRSDLGDDSDENLITLCAACHRLVHGEDQSDKLDH